MVVSSTPATPRASGDCRLSRGNRDPWSQNPPREWRQASHRRKQPSWATRPGYDRYDWD